MTVLPFKIPKTEQESFRIQEDREIHFYDYLHKHPEVQLSLIVQSHGTVTAGDYVGNFKPGDIFIIGANLPHVFRNEDSYYFQKEASAHMLSVYFEWQSFGDRFLSMPELKKLRDFVNFSNRGLYIHEPVAFYVAQLMKQLFKKQEMDRVVVLLKILNLLANSAHANPLASGGVYHDYDEIDERKISDVYRFTLNEFHREIRLDEVASIANLTTNSFCRYFKKRTRKSYIDFLTEIRIGNAKKLLQEKDMSVSQVCFEVGFNTLSNFNRTFKKMCAVTPKAFRQLQRKTLPRPIL